VSQNPEGLTRALADVRSITGLDGSQWDLVVRQARSAVLLSRLASLTKAAGLLPAIPDGPRRHLESAARAGAAHALSVRRETLLLLETLRGVTPVVLLKGAAYEFAGLPAADGRLFSDIDILVPREKLEEVESVLMLAGWVTMSHNAYDQRYYRRWMHELPPMQQISRGTVLDVHHAVSPPTGRIRADSKAMLDSAVPVPDESGLYVLAPVDMLLHSATHLFQEGELDHGLRDLVDIDGLLRHYGARPGFWDQMVPRAREVGLARPLFYALRYAAMILGTPVRQDVLSAAKVGAPTRPLQALMDFLYLRALRPIHPTSSDRWTPVALGMLYVRAHWLRMPLPLLAYHLTRKALVKSDRPVEAPVDQPMANPRAN
jgi:hypothetical protein